MAPEYLSPGVYIEEVSLRAPTKPDLAFGSGDGAKAPAEAVEQSTPTMIGEGIGRDAKSGIAQAEHAPHAAADALAEFDGGHIEEGGFAVESERDVDRTFEAPARDLREPDSAFDEGADAFDA